MLYVKVNDDKKVLFVHNNPLHETEGLGKTREELEQEGFFFEFLKEVPRSMERKGFTTVTYTDGKSFWFDYEENEIPIEEKYLQEIQIMKEKQEELKTLSAQSEEKLLSMASVNEQLSKDLESVNSNMNHTTQNLQGNLNDSAMMLMMLMEREMQIEMQEEAIQESKNLMDVQGTEIMDQTRKISEQQAQLVLQVQEVEEAKEEIIRIKKETVDLQDTLIFQQTSLENAIALTSKLLEDSGSMLMELMNTQVESYETKQALLEANNLLAETAQKVLQANEEMVTTKAELTNAKEQLLLTQADVANLLMMLLEGGTSE